MDLSAFGHQLRSLRKLAGLTQVALGNVVGASENLVSKWERAYTHQGRTWQPDRQIVLALIGCFASQLTYTEAKQWAAQAGHAFSAADLQPYIAADAVAVPYQMPPLPPFHVARPAVEQAIIERLNTSGAVALIGPGGVGKTTLASAVAHQLTVQFSDGIIWAEGRTVTEAQAWIAHSFGVTLTVDSASERAAMLRTLLHSKSCLLILDDVPFTRELSHLYVADSLLLTSRDRKTADVLQLPVQTITGFDLTQAAALLERWTTHQLDVGELVTRVAGLPLAVNLVGAQLRAGHITPVELQTLLAATPLDVTVFDLDDPQTRAESLTLCFDLSYNALDAETQAQFAQLVCFAGQFELGAAAAVWGRDLKRTRKTLQRLVRFALLEAQPNAYRLHPLLRDYAAQYLSTHPKLTRQTYRRYAAYFIQHWLYHPAVLEGQTGPAPELDIAWADIVAAVQWTTTHAPDLTAAAFLLAHTERAPLLDALGPAFLQTVATYITQQPDRPETARWHELLADLSLGQSDFEAGLAHFQQAAQHWTNHQHWLEAARAVVRVAGVHLLQNDPAMAAVTARQAQEFLAQAAPVTSATERVAYQTFYWFDVLYFALIRWPDLPEADVARLVTLAEEVGEPTGIARATHNYAFWCLAPERPVMPELHQRGQALALQTCRLWRSLGRRDRFDDETRLSAHWETLYRRVWGLKMQILPLNQYLSVSEFLRYEHRGYSNDVMTDEENQLINNCFSETR